MSHTEMPGSVKLRLAVRLLAPLCAAASIASCGGAGSARWDSVPYLARDQAASRPNQLAATGLKASVDTMELRIQVEGYSKPPAPYDAAIEGSAGPRSVVRSVTSWRVIVDSDAFPEPCELVFSRGRRGTVCSDPAIWFAERGHSLELAMPLPPDTYSPLRLRVDRMEQLFGGEGEVDRSVASLPKASWCLLNVPGMPSDGRIAKLRSIQVAEIQCTSAVVQWESTKRLTSRVDVASGEEPVKNVCDDQNLRITHAVRLLRLQPDMLYTFSVGGSDIAGVAARPATGTFRTAVPAPGPARQDTGWREVQLNAPAAASADDDRPAGVAVSPKPHARWRIGRELPAGTYRFAIYSWQGLDCPPIEVSTTRSSELPRQVRRAAVIEASADGKLHHFDKVIAVASPFDEVVLVTRAGQAGPVTSVRLYEMTTPQRPVQ